MPELINLQAYGFGGFRQWPLGSIAFGFEHIMDEGLAKEAVKKKKKRKDETETRGSFKAFSSDPTLSKPHLLKVPLPLYSSLGCLTKPACTFKRHSFSIQAMTVALGYGRRH